MRPLEPLLPGETRSEYTAQQLVARIKPSSKYYRLSDVVLGMRTDAITVVNLESGKIEVEV